MNYFIVKVQREEWFPLVAVSRKCCGNLKEIPTSTAFPEVHGLIVPASSVAVLTLASYIPGHGESYRGNYSRRVGLSYENLKIEHAR